VIIFRPLRKKVANTHIIYALHSIPPELHSHLANHLIRNLVLYHSQLNLSNVAHSFSATDDGQHATHGKCSERKIPTL
jgi:hypothetical protein